MVFRSVQAFFQKPPSPESLLLRTLAAAAPGAPSGFPHVSKGTLPCFEADRTLTSFRNGAPLLNTHFTDAIKRTIVGIEEIPLRSVTGCVSSKREFTSFADMAQIGWLAELTRLNRDNVEKLAADIFNGTRDDIVRKGNVGRIYRQAWNGQMWFSNEGGSHRGTSVWAIDSENNFDRLIRSEITEIGFTPGFRNFCATHAIFVFHPACVEDLSDRSYKLGQAGLILGVQDSIYSIGRKPDWCLAVSRNNPAYAEIRDALKDAFDLSGWVLHPPKAATTSSPVFA